MISCSSIVNILSNSKRFFLIQTILIFTTSLAYGSSNNSSADSVFNDYFLGIEQSLRKENAYNRAGIVFKRKFSLIDNFAINFGRYGEDKFSANANRFSVSLNLGARIINYKQKASFSDTIPNFRYNESSSNTSTVDNNGIRYDESNSVIENYARKESNEAKVSRKIYPVTCNFEYDLFSTQDKKAAFFIGTGLGFAHISEKFQITRKFQEFGTISTTKVVNGVESKSLSNITLPPTFKTEKSKKNQWNPVISVSVGARYELTNDLSITGSYRYTDFGKIKARRLSSELKTHSSIYHSSEFVIGLRASSS
jgi:opacity protein-like surface antigen